MHDNKVGQVLQIVRCWVGSFYKAATGLFDQIFGDQARLGNLSDLENPPIRIQI